jgi:hypothetical protein
MRECVDEGILQSYFDGELSSERMESVTSHLASCTACAGVARELEAENSLLASALAPEFEIAVPTERLRHRLDAAIAGLRAVSPAVEEGTARGSIRGWFESLAALFTLTPQRAFGYASLVVVLAFAAIFAVVQLRPKPNSAPLAQETGNQANPPERNNNSDSGNSAPAPVLSVNPTTARNVPPVRRTPKKSLPVKSSPTPGAEQVAVKLLPGERSYLKTIAALDSTIKANGNKPMRPALQAEYERNLALVDRALAAARSAAKKNPNDPETVEFVYSAYQSKVDLLNTVADARVYNRDH